MAKDLTTSAIDRQNILNNPMALPKIRENIVMKFLEYEGQYVITRQMAADFYQVDIRTITNCLNDNEEELRNNGYKVLTGAALKRFKESALREIDFPKNTPQLGIFDFRSFLNLGIANSRSKRVEIEEQFKE